MAEGRTLAAVAKGAVGHLKALETLCGQDEPCRDSFLREAKEVAVAVHRLMELRNISVHDLIARCDGFRQPQRIAQIALACEADKRGRGGMAESDYPQGPELVRLHAAAMTVRGADVIRPGMDGPAVGEALRRARCEAIGKARKPEAG